MGRRFVIVFVILSSVFKKPMIIITNIYILVKYIFIDITEVKMYN